MSQHTTSTEPNTTDAGREANGRFANGNPGGCGNPFARKVAGLRTAMVAAVSDEDIGAITTRLVRDARDGDKTATKLLFQYVIGKPGPAVNPDTLVLDEFRLLQQSAVPAEALTPMLRGVPVEFWLQLWPLFAEAQAAQLARQFQELCARADEKDRRAAERAARKEERKQQREETVTVPPSTNGSDGEERLNPPSTDGDNGDGMLAALFDWLRGQRGPSGDGPRT
jgi:hypothetical protein